MYDKILVAIDGSENARLAVEHAASIGGLAHSEDIIVLHVCAACSADLDPEEKNLELAKELVRKAGDVIKKAGLPVTRRVETDYQLDAVGNAIVDIAVAEGASLIIVGSRGLSEFKGMLMGSVSSRVAQRAECPVLVVKSPAVD